MYVPMLMTNELARKDHVCESSYSSTIYAVDVKGKYIELDRHTNTTSVFDHFVKTKGIKKMN